MYKKNRKKQNEKVGRKVFRKACLAVNSEGNSHVSPLGINRKRHDVLDQLN